MSPLVHSPLPLLGLIGAFAVGGGALLWWRTSALERELVSAPQESHATAERTAATGPKLRLVMSAAYVSESGVGAYKQIARYLARKTGIETEFVDGLAYSTINSMIEDGTLNSGFICGLPYVLLHDRPSPAAQPLAAPIRKGARYKGEPRYYSDLIVRKESPYQRLQELKGRTYVYNDEISNAGYNMPRYRLLQLGLTDGFFGKVLRSGSHEESIRMVATGEADASFVDSLVLDYDREKGLGHAQEVRVIESVGPSTVGPLVVSTRIPAELRDKLQRELLRMHEDPEGRRLLDEALLERFVRVDDASYADVRSMKEAAEKAGFTVIR